MANSADEPSYRAINWEPTFDLGPLGLPDRMVHDLEMALEWSARRLADGMTDPTPEGGLEVMKQYGDPPTRAFWRLEEDGSIGFFWIEEDPGP